MKDKKIYAYTLEKHNVWLEKVRKAFAMHNVEISETFIWLNSSIKAVFKKGEYYKITLTLSFQEEKEIGTIVVACKPLTEIRSFVSYKFEGWDCAITGFKTVVESIDDYLVAAVQNMLQNLRYTTLWLKQTERQLSSRVAFCVKEKFIIVILIIHF